MSGTEPAPFAGPIAQKTLPCTHHHLRITEKAAVHQKSLTPHQRSPLCASQTLLVIIEDENFLY